jgi:hypothetical protein
LVCVARDLASELARPDGRQLLQRALDAGPVEIRVLGVSMRPLLRAGDRIRLDRRAPRRGDVALVEVSKRVMLHRLVRLVEVSKRVMLHRLVRRRRDRWLVRGDARSRSDGWVAAHQVLAIATARRRDGDSRANPRWKRLDHPPARVLGLVAARLGRIARCCMPWRRGAAREQTLPGGAR